MEKIALHQFVRLSAMISTLQQSKRHAVLKLCLCRHRQIQSFENCKQYFLSPATPVGQHKFMSTSSSRGLDSRVLLISSSHAVKKSILSIKDIGYPFCSLMPSNSQHHGTLSQTLGCFSVHFNTKYSGSRAYSSTRQFASEGQLDSLNKGSDDHREGPLPHNIASVVRSVIEAGSQVDKMILAIPQKRIESIIKALLTEGIPLDQAKTLLLEKPGLLKQNKLKQIFSLLKSYDFCSQDMFRVLQGVPNLSDLRENHIENVFGILRAVGLGDGKLQNLILSEPGTLGLDGRSIESRISKLKMFFKTEDVAWVMIKSPIVLTCDWHEVEEKFRYVSEEMNISQRQIMYSQLFGYDLDHVKCRHQFLVRAGLFRMDSHAKSANPRLQDIIDTSDAEFTKRFGGMDVDEYRTFCKLMAKSELSEKSEESN